MVLFVNSDITIYNKYYDFTSGNDMYQRTVVKDVDWQGKRNATVSNTGLLLADSIVIIIDKLENYVSPKQFAKLSDDERVNYFTLAMGDKIVKGVIDFEVLGISPYRIADLEKDFDDVVNVMSSRPLSDHWEVEGK
ncbi:DUF6751 family protein [Clostridium lacusfryxellense]|uniref:DUF6751 family protein n=1 Tax=Clostridium lacusfryxellense TaxID=205328 RepID=UPI001C0B299F|nr:DUF6751 family protein [Clostridium lacusfryxellense]MBU3112000.1 hypothetical protein [Clostridium lacusfryxellense]